MGRIERSMDRVAHIERLMGPSPAEKVMQEMGKRFARPLLPAVAMDRPSPMVQVMDQVAERFARPLLPAVTMDRPSPMDKVMAQVGERLTQPLIPPVAMERLARPLMPSVTMRPLIPPVAMETATDRMMKRLARPLIDTSAMDAAVGHLERPLFSPAALERLLERQSPVEKLLERVAQQLARPLIDTSALDRATELFEQSAVSPSALSKAAADLGRWLDDASTFGGTVEVIDAPPPDPALIAALMGVARTLARKAGNVDIAGAQAGLHVAWGAFGVFMATYTDDEISPAVYAWVSLLFALLSLAAPRQR